MKKHYSVSQLIERVKKGYYTRKGNEPVFGSGRGKRQKEYGDEVRKLANRLANQVKKTGSYNSEAFDLLLEAIEKQENNERIAESDITKVKKKKGKNIYIENIKILDVFIKNLESFTLSKAEWVSWTYRRTGTLKKHDIEVLEEVKSYINNVKVTITDIYNDKYANTRLSKYVQEINYLIDRMMYDYDGSNRDSAYMNVIGLISGNPMSIEESEVYEDWEYYEE